MKTTLELPDELFRSAKIAAAQQGRSLKELFTEALREKLGSVHSAPASPPWTQLFGAFGKSKQASRETKRIQTFIDAEFEQIDPLER